MRLFHRLGSVLLAAAIILLSVAPVFAIADPTVPPELPSVYVYNLDDGGIGIICEYHLHYAPLPTVADPNDTATNAYLVSFLDIGGAPLRAVAPYSYHDSGYGVGIAWIRFTAAEVITLSIDAVDVALYTVRIEGNPTIPSGWGGAIPSITASITDWFTTGDPKVLLALRIISYAQILDPIWTPIDLLESTALGPRLSTTGVAAGEDYFQNVIPGLRVLAPNAFASSELTPSLEDINYDTTFSAVAESGTATLTVSPHILQVGTDTLDTGATIGTITITLSSTAAGTIADGTGTFVGVSPAVLVAGVNTIDVDGAGTFIVVLTQTDLQAAIDTATTGTGFDVTPVATIFGMTQGLLSTVLWLIMGVVLVAASYGGLRKGEVMESSSAGKTSMFLYGTWMIIGMLLGVLLAKVMCFLFIGYGAFIGYILFYRNSSGDVGRNVAFMGWMWVVVCLAGGMLNGMVPQASTHLDLLLTDVGLTVTVASTEGFRSPGILVIDSERIAYYDTTPTTFIGTGLRPLARGTGGTEAVAHLVNTRVRMPESSLLNDSMSYNLALISDAAGIMSFITVPIAIWNIITDFLFLPLSFLGTDLVIITVIWGIIVLGVIITLMIQMTGGRRI